MAVYRWVACCACLLWPALTFGQSYPDRPIRIVVSFPPGGAADFMARILAQRLPATLGQTIVIDNRGGAGGNIGNDIVSKATPDGYTLLITAEGTVTINPSVYTRLPYVALRDLMPITQLIKYANVVVLHPSVPAGSMRELIALAKAKPGLLRYSHPGVGTGQHLGAELFKLSTGVDFITVPYKGGGPSMVALMGNETQFAFATPPSSMPHVKNGKLKAIAVTTARRSAALPDLPTIAESGVPGFDLEGWIGLFAPMPTPRRIVNQLYGEVAKVLAIAEVKDLVLTTGGAETGGGKPDETLDIVRKETAMWAKVVKSTGVKVE